VSGAEQARLVVAMKLDVDNVELPGGPSMPGVVRAYVNDGERAALGRLGLIVQPILDEARVMAVQAEAERKAKGIPPESSVGLSAAAAWPTYAEYVTDLQAVAAAHPTICRLVSLGNSVQGRAMWIMKITSNVDVEGAKPEFKFTSSIHGDEDTGMELSRRMIHYLAENYGTDTRVTNLVNNVEIWILPLHNPDGYVNVSRYNANGYDLNRVFPDPNVDPTDTPVGRPLEDQNIMNFGYAHNFILSANYHGGALVANYPWDVQSYPRAPDDVLAHNISLAYSATNLPMWNSPYFTQGVTEGADWYVVNGGMQDWCYYWRNELDITIEVSTTKKPVFTLMDTFWNENRESMLTFMERTYTRGVVRGIVTSAVTGLPLSATVGVVQVGKSILSDPDVGDYHRMLEPGTYTLTFSRAGYDTRTFTNVSVSSVTPTTLDVTLMPAGTTDVLPAVPGMRLALSAPRPNPAFLSAGPVSMDLSVPGDAAATAGVFGIDGRQVRSLQAGLATRAGGTRTITWDGRDDRGAQVACGVYWVKVSAGAETVQRRVAVLR
jgi:carboxypeptidase D